MSESAKMHKAHAPKTLNFAVFVCSTSRYLSMQKGEQVTDVSGDTIEFLLKASISNIGLKLIISIIYKLV